MAYLAILGDHKPAIFSCKCRRNAFSMQTWNKMKFLLHFGSILGALFLFHARLLGLELVGGPSGEEDFAAELVGTPIDPEVLRAATVELLMRFTSFSK